MQFQNSPPPEEPGEGTKGEEGAPPQQMEEMETSFAYSRGGDKSPCEHSPWQPAHLNQLRVNRGNMRASFQVRVWKCEQQEGFDVLSSS